MTAALTPLKFDKIDFHDPSSVAELVVELHREIFPNLITDYIPARFSNVAEMFRGNYPGYQSMDTAYHDLEHTMQATLCMFYLLANRHRTGALPVLEETDFNIALVAILLHDIGYIKEMGDDEGTGAKYTHVHEFRSCRHAREYLRKRNWPEEAIQSVERLISCTGPRSDITTVRFTSDEERVMGHAICTADFIGQMGDPRYVEKLPLLYQEFEESYDFQDLDAEERPFTSYEDMLQKTPEFWDKFLHWKMDVQCRGIWRYLEDSRDRSNPYIDTAKDNMEKIRGLIKREPSA